MKLSADLIDSAYSYAAYRKLIDQLLLEGKTTGANQSESMISYAILSQKRMQKWEKIGKLLPALEAMVNRIDVPMTWLVITEGWCGDAGQLLPFVHKMAQLNPQINLRLILRDENPEVMNNFLTNGARSIPIIIGLSADGEVLGHWGPRPDLIQREFLENKQTQAKSGKEFTEYMHLWYAKDKGASIQSEFLAILGVWIQKQQSLPMQAG